jgi:hypothetical protein
MRHMSGVQDHAVGAGFRLVRIFHTVVMQLAKTTMYCAEISMSGMSGDVGLIFAVQKISRSTTLYYIRTYGKSVSPQGPVELVLMAKIFPFPTVLRLHSLTHSLTHSFFKRQQLPSLVSFLTQPNNGNSWWSAYISVRPSFS